MLAFLSGAWAFVGSPLGGRLGAGLALILALGFVGQCTAKDAAQREAARLSAAIHAPRTGWSARLATCQANTASLEQAVSGQSAAVASFKAAMDRQQAEHAKAIEAALAGKARAERSAARLADLARTMGPDACADLAAADAAVLKELKP